MHTGGEQSMTIVHQVVAEICVSQYYCLHLHSYCLCGTRFLPVAEALCPSSCARASWDSETGEENCKYQ